MARIKSGFLGERAIVIPTPIIDDLKSNELGSLLHITDIGYYPKANFHFRSRTKEEAYQYIFIYCIEGFGWFEIDGVRQKVAPDHFFILPKHKAHAYGTNPKDPWTIYWIHFDGEKAAFFSEGMDKATLISTEKDSRIEERFQLFEEIFATLKNGYSKNNLEYSISSFFHFLGSLKFLGAYHDSIYSNRKQLDAVDSSIHFMRENLHKRLTLAEIANYVILSPSHFSSLFQKKTGYSPLNYLLQLKVQQTCHYLDFSDMKINQIAMMVGYDDPFYFSRFFTKTMGISPSDYRRKKKG
jgi:AraC family transcriptional regulator of arabinose operon